MQSNKSFYIGILLAIIGVVLFSSKAVLVKMAYKYGVSSTHLLLFRMIFSLPFYILFVFFAKFKTKQQTKLIDYIWIIFFGFIGYYLASYFDFLGLQYIKAGLERIILFIYPTLVIVFSYFLFKKKINKNQILAILVSYIGVFITFWDQLSFGMDGVVLGGFLVFLSAVTYAIYIVGSGWLIPKFGTVLFTSYAMIVSSICIIIQYFVVDFQSINTYQSEVYWIAIFMAIFSTLIPSFLVSEAIAKLGASQFSIVACIGPFSTILLAYFFLEEHISFLQLVGSSLVVLAIYMISKTGK